MLLTVGSGTAQGWGPAKVGVTAARSAPVQEVVRLAGSVETRTRALVAATVPGLVVEQLAREGDFVRRGTTLVRLLRETLERELEAAQAQLAEARARLDLAQRARTRSRELQASGVISQQQFDGAESEADAWQGRVDQATAEIARLEVVVERSRVRAPFSGIVVREHCQLGEWVATGGPVAEMIDLRNLEVVVNVPQRHFSALREGMQAMVSFDSLPELDVEGTVTAIIPVADAETRAFPVKISIDNNNQRIAIGMSAAVTLPSGQPRQATVVPKDALVSDGQQRLVYRVDPGPPGEDGARSWVATAVPVAVGAGIGEWVEVSMITAGDQVITRGNERLLPGAAITTEPTEYDDP